MKQKLTCASFFAGVGGIDQGFEETGRFETVYANEFDPYPAKTFQLNFPHVKLDVCDIKEIDPETIPDVDVIFGGFPCQAFSIAGHRQGFEDEKGRGTLFFDLMKIVRTKKPKIVFLENVKNLVGHDHGNTFKVICEELTTAGYTIDYKVLNAMEYGNIPQNRERIYIVGFLNSEMAKNFTFPEPTALTNTIRDVIDFEHEVDDKYYYIKGRYKDTIYQALQKGMDDPNAIYQWRRTYVRKNKSSVIPTLTANQGAGGHNVCLIRCDDKRIRKMTPKECFNAQGFPKEFILPNDVCDSRLYKQAGNSVCVSVINRIAENIFRAYEACVKQDTKRTIDQKDLEDYLQSLTNEHDRILIQTCIDSISKPII